MQDNTLFEQWLLKKYEVTYSSSNETELRRELEAIGIHIDSLFSLHNSHEIRIYASELVVKRPLCTAPDFSSFKSCVELLLLYAEYIDNPKQDQTYISYGKDKTRDSLTVAYYLSRFNKEALASLGYQTFSEAFNDLGKILGQKPSTIKNMRDEFDPYFENGRVGWYQKGLSASRRKVFDEFQNKSDREIGSIVDLILKTYSEPKPNGILPHKTIKLSGENMKEIKSKRKM